MSDVNKEWDKIWNEYTPEDKVWDDPNFDEVNMIIEYGEDYYAGMYEGTEDPDVPTTAIYLIGCYKKVGKKWIRQGEGPHGEYEMSVCSFELEFVSRALVPKKNLDLDEIMKLFDKS